jgi:DNA-binding Lrp family transcriptional regulator
MDDAPMLRTVGGKPDTTARHVLQALAEHARKDGSNAHPSMLRIRYRTGYDKTTTERAMRRLEQAGLIKRDGVVGGRTCWRLAVDLRRPASDWKELEAEEDALRTAAAERKRRSRAKRVTGAKPVTVTGAESVTVTHSESVTGDIPDSESAMSQAQSLAVTGAKPVTHRRKACDTGPPPAETHPKSWRPTTNQPPVQEREGGRPSHSEGPGTTGLHLIPDDFHLNDQMRRWSVSTFGQALDPQFETEQFISYWRSEGRRKRNWHDAWQKWMRDSANHKSERAQRGNGRAYQPSPEERGVF